MSATATITGTEPQGGLMAYATVDDNGTETTLAVYVSPTTLTRIPGDQLPAYLQARALYGAGHIDAALALVTPLATGSAPTVPNGTDTRNWAALWVGGQVLS